MQVKGTSYEVVPIGSGDRLHYRVCLRSRSGDVLTLDPVLPERFTTREEAEAAAKAAHRAIKQAEATWAKAERGSK